MPVNHSDYSAPFWIPGGNLQTIVPAELMRPEKVAYRREIWNTPDGDIIAVDWSTPEPLDPKAPVMVHFHGLEGSSESHYALELMAKCAENNIRGIVIHYRGCGGIENKKFRAYCAADTTELQWIFEKIRRLFPEAPVFSMGVSLGANNLLFWLGTGKEKVNGLINAAVAICSPMDLIKSSERITTGFSKIYDLNFIRTMKEKAIKKAKEFPGYVDLEAIKKIKDLKDFDDVITSKMFGYKDALDYWKKCSSRQVLKDITVPTLVINAFNDPIVGKDSLPSEDEVSDKVVLEYTQDGGHCGYPLGPFPGNLGYLPKRTLDFCLNHHL